MTRASARNHRLRAATAELAGKIFGAGLDVFDQEPPPADNPLFKLENVVIGAHVRGRSGLSREFTVTYRGHREARWTDAMIAGSEPLVS